MLAIEKCNVPVGDHRRFVSLHPRPRRRETYHIMFFFAKESVLIFIFMSCVVMMLSHSVLHMYYDAVYAV